MAFGRFRVWTYTIQDETADIQTHKIIIDGLRVRQKKRSSQAFLFLKVSVFFFWNPVYLIFPYRIFVFNHISGGFKMRFLRVSIAENCNVIVNNILGLRLIFVAKTTPRSRRSRFETYQGGIFVDPLNTDFCLVYCFI